jgi:hypothetical protein
MKYPQEKLKGITNHYASPIHMGVSKIHHVNIFQHSFLHHQTKGCKYYKRPYAITTFTKQNN